MKKKFTALIMIILLGGIDLYSCSYKKDLKQLYKDLIPIEKYCFKYRGMDSFVSSIYGEIVTELNIIYGSCCHRCRKYAKRTAFKKLKKIYKLLFD